MSLYTAPHQAGHRGVGTVIPKARDDQTKLRSPRACMILASSGLEPKEVHETWESLTKNGFLVDFATWDGKPAVADPTLLSHSLWGSSYVLQQKWTTIITLSEWLEPLAWAPLTRPSAATSATREVAGSQADQTENTSRTLPDLEHYDLVFIPGGWATRQLLENDTKLHELLTKYCLNLPRHLGSKVLAVVGDGISPLLHVKDALTDEPLLKKLESTGPGYDSWTGIITGKDLGSLIPSLVKKYINKKVTVDPDNWYISSPSSAYNQEFCHALVALVYSAVRVSELRKLERNSKRLSTLQTNQLEAALKFDGLTTRQKERLNSDGIGRADSGFVMTNWSWGWRQNLN